MTTFAELGIPFPLFEADTREARGYMGIASCSLCGNHSVHCFGLGIGAETIVPCWNCDTENALLADEGKDQECRSCGHLVSFPEVSRDQYRHFPVCYQCLRAGRAAIAKDTEFGAVTWEQANMGLTGPVPTSKPEPVWISDGPNIVGTQPPLEPPPGDFERVWVAREGAFVTDPESKWMDWYATRVPQEHLFELLRTPGYRTCQGERWPFHCRQPMVYIGAWDHGDFDAHAADGNGRALFDAVVPYADDRLWEGKYDAQGIYVFRCASCRKLAAHWDFA